MNPAVLNLSIRFLQKGSLCKSNDFEGGKANGVIAGRTKRREGLHNEVRPFAFIKSRIDWIAGKIQSLEAGSESTIY